MPILTGHSLADRSGRLLAIDSNVCEILQREERHLIGVAFEALTHPGDRNRNSAAVANLSISDRPLSIRKRYLRPDGSFIWSDVQVSRLEAKDGNRLVGTIQLISPESLKQAPANRWRSAKRAAESLSFRRRELGEDLFSDYFWAILLQIYLAEAEGREASLSWVCEASGTRASAIHRWLMVLEQKGLVERTEWPDHAPQLTTLGMRHVEKVLDRAGDC